MLSLQTKAGTNSIPDEADMQLKAKIWTWKGECSECFASKDFVGVSTDNQQADVLHKAAEYIQDLEKAMRDM